MTVDVSVLIPQYGRSGFTVRCVRAVQRSRGDLQFEVRVHDNGSAEGVGPVAEMDDVILSQSSQNLGFGPAIDLLAEQAKGRHLLILNNDTLVHPDAIRRLVDRIDADPQSGPVVPMYRDFAGRVLELGGGLGEGGRAWQLFRGASVPSGLLTVPHRVDYGSAAAMLIDRDLFLSAGGFDDAFAPAYFEDTDLCLRLAQQGRPPVVEPRAVVFHYEGGTAGTDLGSGLKSYQVRNQATFVQRWGDHLAANGPVGLQRAICSATEPAPGQPRILWLGSVLPRGDRDGGGRRTMEMVRALRSQGVGIAFHARSVHDPDRYGAHLGTLGIPWFGGSAPARWVGAERPTSSYDHLRELLRAAPWDVVVVFSARLGRKVTQTIREHASDAAVVIDNGDLHFLRHDRGRALGVEILDPLTKDQELDAYMEADGVITSSDPEDAVLREELPGISTHVFTVAPPEPVEVEPALDGAAMFLGNFGHPPNTDAVEYWTRALAPRVHEKLGQRIRLRVVGSGTDGLQASPDVEVAGWAPSLTAEFARTRVFFAPLRYGAGTKGKILEAMAHGVPVVTTPNGAEGFPRFVVDSLEVGTTDDELVDALVRLMSDDNAWREAQRTVAAAAARFHEKHGATAAPLAAWLMGRGHARRHGTVTRVSRARPRQEATTPDHVVTDAAQPHDREFKGMPASSTRLTPEPIFVVGAPRSGTSMMAHALGQHPDLWVGEESDFLLPLARGAREAWEFGRQRGDFHWLFAGGVSWEEFLHYVGCGMNALYTSRAEGLRWVEQTPQYTVDLATVATMFPGARFVYMLRDGRSVVHSLASFVRPVPHERASHLWARYVREGLRFVDSADGDRICIVRYEQMVSDTGREMEVLSDFLGLDVVPEMSAFIADRSPINSSFIGADAGQSMARWSTWSREQREVFHAAAGDLLVSLGFEANNKWVRD